MEEKQNKNYEKIAVAIILGAIIIGVFILLSNQSMTIYLVENATKINMTLP